MDVRLRSRKQQSAFDEYKFVKWPVVFFSSNLAFFRVKTMRYLVTLQRNSIRWHWSLNWIRIWYRCCYPPWLLLESFSVFFLSFVNPKVTPTSYYVNTISSTKNFTSISFRALFNSGARRRKLFRLLCIRVISPSLVFCRFGKWEIFHPQSGPARSRAGPSDDVRCPAVKAVLSTSLLLEDDTGLWASCDTKLREKSQSGTAINSADPVSR